MELDWPDELKRLAGESTVRLAVTGLAGAGKTVFITSLLHNLQAAAAHPEALPLLRPVARRRLVAARIVPETGVAFPYPRLVREMAAEPPRWPESTIGTSRIRLALRYRTEHVLWSRIAPVAKLSLDIIDYPGEWLLDLPMMAQSYDEWSRATLGLAATEPRRALAAPFLDFIGANGPNDAASEDTARNAAELYREYLRRCRTEHGLSLLQPGRLLSPGEFALAPFLWLCPLPVGAASPRPGTLHALMAQRFDEYRDKVVAGFYREHFRRFDRQVVLVDVLRALDAGEHAFADARRALAAILESFRFGRSRFLASLFGGARIDRVLFLATKADHVTPAHYANLRQLLERMMLDPAEAMRFQGGEVRTGIVASARCTELGTGVFDGRPVGMLIGTLVGESERKVLFPGEVPAVPPDPGHWGEGRPDFPSFQPPRIEVQPVAGVPQIGLDDALQYLVGDKLA
jgi:predicted YcjX-like family ATPase